MSATTISRPPFSIPLFTQLVRRLRTTNARYAQIAYQCRRAQCLTHHAKRRAYQVGLRIDTSKAWTAWTEEDVYVSVSVSAASTRTAGSLVSVATETETEVEEEDLPNPWPELPVIMQQQPMARLSPLGLELNNIDDLDTPFRGHVPAAPRWRAIPLPADECDGGMETMTNAWSSSEALCTYEPVWRGVKTTHVSDLVWMPTAVGYGSLRITVSTHHLKRKLQDIDVDSSMTLPKRLGVARGSALGTWNEVPAQRWWGGL